MGLRRWLTTMSCLTVAGIVLERPEAIVRLMPSFVGALRAEQPVADGATEALPHYIPGGRELTFKSDGKDDGGDGTSDESSTEGDGGSPPPDAVSADPAAHTTAAIAPKDETPPGTSTAGAASNNPGLPVEAAPPSAPSAAAIDPIAPPAAKPVEPPPVRNAAITIEPDPTLPQPAPAKPAPPPVIPAKKLFGAAKVPAPLAARAIGTYARGCLAGGVALPVDGPAWQAMRLSRNRNWGHPSLVKMVERLALESKHEDGWPGLLVGDISQPRGGPMLTGHASHQVGLDADVWLTPMPDKRLSRKEREVLNATSMLDSTSLAVNPKVFSERQVKLIKRAASYPEVERVLVHPAIKKALCEVAGTDRGWLAKVRPLYGHYYHFHIRIGCPKGSGATCKPQIPVTGEDGCGKEVTDWLARVVPAKGPPKPKPPGYKPPPPKPPITLAGLPQECTAVLESGPNGVPVPPEAKIDLKAIAKAPAALKPHLRKMHHAKN